MRRRPGAKPVAPRAPLAIATAASRRSSGSRSTAAGCGASMRIATGNRSRSACGSSSGCSRFVVMTTVNPRSGSSAAHRSQDGRTVQSRPCRTQRAGARARHRSHGRLRRRPVVRRASPSPCHARSRCPVHPLERSPTAVGIQQPVMSAAVISSVQTSRWAPPVPDALAEGGKGLPGPRGPVEHDAVDAGLQGVLEILPAARAGGSPSGGGASRSDGSTRRARSPCVAARRRTDVCLGASDGLHCERAFAPEEEPWPRS